MARKTRAKPVIPVPKRPPDSFTRSELLKAIRKVWPSRRRQQHTSVSDLRGIGHRRSCHLHSRRRQQHTSVSDGSK